jgi:flagellum-specific ATP synthase
MEPVADAARSILDGHIVLSNELAGANHFPAIDVLNSQSRVFTEIVTPEHRRAAAQLRNMMASYARARDLIDVGAYVAGSNPETDRAIKAWPKIVQFLQQQPEESVNVETVLRNLGQIAGIS